MKSSGVTLEQLAGALGYEVRSQGNYKYIRVKYDGYFRFGTYYKIIVYKKNDDFIIFCRVNIPKATVSEIIIEQNGVKIVIEELINQTINKIMNKKKFLLIGNIENGVVYAGETVNGMVYKSEEAYLEHPDEICYVPEHGFPEEEQHYQGAIKNVCGYTRNTLLELCENNQNLCDSLFREVDWQFPETWLNEFEE